MFSIGEFARLGGVSVRTLRHYDEVGLLRPVTVDPDTGYRGYSARQLEQLNRILALKELGLSLTQARRLLDGITVEELHGMLILRRAQLEHELDQHKNWLLGVEARLRSIAREGAMTADDIVTKTIPAMGVVVIAGQAPGWGSQNIVPVVNRLVGQFDQLGIHDRVKEAGLRLVFYDYGDGENVTVHLALPVAEPPGELPAPRQSGDGRAAAAFASAAHATPGPADGAQGRAPHDPGLAPCRRAPHQDRTPRLACGTTKTSESCLGGLRYGKRLEATLSARPAGRR
jgi:DNA-binding transcriptional MerR regulator